MAILPSVVLPQRLPQATTVNLFERFLTAISPGWGIVDFAVVGVFESDDLFLLVMYLLNHIGHFQSVADQAAEGGRQLVQGRFFQRFFVHALEHSMAALEHIELKVGEEASALAGAPLLILPAQQRFILSPVFQRLAGDIHVFADSQAIAVAAVHHVERLDFRIQSIVAPCPIAAPFRTRSVLFHTVSVFSHTGSVLFLATCRRPFSWRPVGERGRSLRCVCVRVGESGTAMLLSAQADE